MKVKAAILLVDCEGVQVDEDLTSPDPGLGEVVVQVTASGICASDRHVMGAGMSFGPAIGIVGAPIVLGHELVGRVLSVGPAVRTLRVGDRVIGASTPVCSRCDSCLQGFSNMCEMFAEVVVKPRYLSGNQSLTAMCGLGSFADTAVLREEQLVRVDTDLPDAELSLVGCGVVSGAGAVFNRGQVSPGATVLVVGCGGVGLAAVQAARICGAARILVVDPVAEKRAAAMAVGATEGIDPADAPVVEQVLELTKGAGVGTAIEAVGGVEAAQQALAATGRGGTCVQVGAPRPGEQMVLPPGAGERFLVTSVYGSGNVRRDIPRLVTLAETGLLDLTSMVSRRIGLVADDINLALVSPGPTDIRTVIQHGG